ncbi:hypothetical protein [Actinoplanes sp. N902-109]|uniref:hypothetical protein n=1 Tax=Actinoplanes sp. (strain N902-109) TaxID=649831 RepID=UPI0003295181|nr:hypothetical protein [Actinoplanes sp. N902-109]AGL17686.1 hypothetical protein L083_4176 [Actinoplanes sp. N902-109]
MAANLRLLAQVPSTLYAMVYPPRAAHLSAVVRPAGGNGTAGVIIAGATGSGADSAGADGVGRRSGRSLAGAGAGGEGLAIARLSWPESSVPVRDWRRCVGEPAYTHLPAARRRRRGRRPVPDRDWAAGRRTQVRLRARRGLGRCAQR